MNYRHYDHQHIKSEDVYEYHRIPLMKKLKRYYRLADLFAYPVTLKYKGERRFYTNFGALTSIVIILVMVSLVLVQLITMFKRKQMTFQETSQLADATDFPLGNDQGFIFAYRIVNKTDSSTFNFSGYLNIKVEQITEKYIDINLKKINNTSINVPVLSKRSIEMGPCKKKDYLRGSDFTVQQIQRMKIEEFSCPRNKSYKVRGTFLDQEYTFISLSVKRCDPKTGQKNCRTTQEINTAVNQLEVQFVFTNANFDQKDLYDPVKNYFDARLSEGLMVGFQKKYDVYIQNSTATLHNDFLLIKEPEQLRFYQVRQIEKYIAWSDPKDENIMTFELKASTQSAIFERKLFSVVDIFTQIGGIKTSLMLAGLCFCAAFQQTLFQASLIRKLFHFPARFESERRDLHQKKKKLKDTLRNRERAGSVIEEHNQYLESQDNLLTPHEIAEAIQRDKLLGIQEIKDEINTVTGRKGAADFKLKTLGILKGMLCCTIFRKYPHLRQSPRTRQLLFYQKGEDRLNRELDVQYILKNIRKIKYLMKILLDKDQRRLLALKQTEYISSDLDEYDPSNYKKHLLKNKLINLYIDNLRSKKLKRSDIKLLEITGFKKVIELLTKQRAIERVKSDWNKGDDDWGQEGTSNYHLSALKREHSRDNSQGRISNGYQRANSNGQNSLMSLSMSPKRVQSAGFLRAPGQANLSAFGMGGNNNKSQPRLFVSGGQKNLFEPNNRSYQRRSDEELHNGATNALDIHSQTMSLTSQAHNHQLGHITQYQVNNDINKTLDSISENITHENHDSRGTMNRQQEYRQASTLMNQMLEDDEGLIGTSSPENTQQRMKEQDYIYSKERGDSENKPMVHPHTMEDESFPSFHNNQLLVKRSSIEDNAHFKEVESMLFQEDDEQSNQAQLRTSQYPIQQNQHQQKLTRSTTVFKGNQSQRNKPPQTQSHRLKNFSPEDASRSNGVPRQPLLHSDPSHSNLPQRLITNDTQDGAAAQSSLGPYVNSGGRQATNAWPLQSQTSLRRGPNQLMRTNKPTKLYQNPKKS